METLASTGTGVTVETFRAESGGCLAYLVVDEAGRTAMAIDVREDQVQPVMEALAARALRLVHVLDTHTHADHVSGGRRLSRLAGGTLVAHAASGLRAPARRVRGGDRLELGASTVAVLDAPGHTPDSLALLVDGHLFTGDALLAGGAGRTDFPGGSASDLFDTLRTLEALPDATIVHPGHDYVGRPVTTLGAERDGNPLLRERERGAFVARLAGTASPPANMAAIIRHNLNEAEAATIAPGELEALRGQSVPLLLLDVRSPLEFESERIEGSRNLPLEALDAGLDALPEADIVVVCRTGVRATLAAETLARGGRRARVLEGGVHAWRRAGLPLRRGRRRLPVDRQVQLIAGSMVLTGVALGALVSPWFLLLAGFFGAGLTFAGATGTCGLALVLMRLPWNRSAGPGTTDGGAACGAPASCAAPAAPAVCAAPIEPRR